MDLDLILFLVGFPLVYIAGILTHKYVVSEANTIKDHVTAEIQEVRADLASVLRDAKTCLYAVSYGALLYALFFLVGIMLWRLAR